VSGDVEQTAANAIGTFKAPWLELEFPPSRTDTVPFQRVGAESVTPKRMRKDETDWADTAKRFSESRH
jgi:hypothetical protein